MGITRPSEDPELVYESYQTSKWCHSPSGSGSCPVDVYLQIHGCVDSSSDRIIVVVNSTQLAQRRSVIRIQFVCHLVSMCNRPGM